MVFKSAHRLNVQCDTVICMKNLVSLPFLPLSGNNPLSLILQDQFMDADLSVSWQVLKLSSWNLEIQ